MTKFDLRYAFAQGFMNKKHMEGDWLHLDLHLLSKKDLVLFVEEYVSIEEENTERIFI